MKPTEPGLAALNDAEIARRALKLLAERKVIPTPETYADAFFECSGSDARSGEINTILKDLWNDLVRQNRLSNQESAQMLQAAQRRMWSSVRDGTGRALARHAGALGEMWPSTLVEILRQVDVQHAGWTRARKLDAVSRVVEATGEPGLALERLRRLVESWGKPVANPAGAKPVPAGAPADAAPVAAGDTTERAATAQRDLVEAQSVAIGLQRLLRLLCDNLGQLIPDEPWLASQVELVKGLLGQQVGAVQVAAAERRLAELGTQQMQARRGLHEAKVALTEMLATLLERVTSMGSSAERFNDQVGVYQQELNQLQQTPNMMTLSRIVQGLLSETQTVRDHIDVSRRDLADARKKVEVYEARVSQLEQQLSEVSTLVKKDPLTSALNRRGLEQAYGVESARAQRYGAPLTLCMLDLDNFKQINDRLGHAGGDRALVHFVTTAHAILRPTDLTGRTGGEEFGLLFPAVSTPEGIEAVQRLQRELARRPFVFEGERLILTFSAGVAQWQAGDTLEQLMQRADAALYEAKKSGKNRVCAERLTPDRA